MAKSATAKKTAGKSAAKTAASAPASTGDEKSNVLKPPPGAKVAIVEFLDLQCPDCARCCAACEGSFKSGKHTGDLPRFSLAYAQLVVSGRGDRALF